MGNWEVSNYYNINILLYPSFFYDLGFEILPSYFKFIGEE